MKEKSKKKPVLIVLGVILALIAVIVTVLAVNASRNMKAMNAMIDQGLNEVKAHYTLTPCDAGAYTDQTMYGVMKFHTEQYEVENLGNLSVMTTNMGMMQMVSFMITPFEKNVPLCTLDFMYIMGNRKSYVEFYDLAGNTESAEYDGVIDALRETGQHYADVPELELSETWYDSLLSVVMHKSLTGKEEERNTALFCDMLKAYLDASAALPQCTPEEAAAQLDKTENYSNGLIEKGGVSTDAFKKAFGEETTRDFFNKVFFGTDRYRETP
ncbi:MAG: hypothetical protein IKN55_01050 [Oscillospiraceae bacterium]|nr:hypothetical protein [Oscillospiraceae bacterium]